MECVCGEIMVWSVGCVVCGEWGLCEESESVKSGVSIESA